MSTLLDRKSRNPLDSHVIQAASPGVCRRRLDPNLCVQVFIVQRQVRVSIRAEG